MNSPQHSRSPRSSPYILRPVPIRRSLAGEAASTSPLSPLSLLSPIPSTPPPISSPRSQNNNNSPIPTSSSSSQPTNYSNGGFLIKPQLLKKSPFDNFPAGVATSQSASPKATNNPAQSNSPLLKNQFEKWSTSIKSWSPTPRTTATPLPFRSTPGLTTPQPRPPSQEPNRILRSRSSLFSPLPNQTLGLGSPTIFQSENPLSLSNSTNYRSPPRAPSSISSFSTPTPCSPAFPLDSSSPLPLGTPPSTPSQYIANLFGPPAQTQPQLIFRLDPRDHSIVAVTPNDTALIEATQQLDTMNLVKSNSNQPSSSAFNREAMSSSIGNPVPGPSHQANTAPTQTPSIELMETGSSNGIFCSDDNKIILHYPKPQRPTQPPPPLPPRPIPQPPRKVQPVVSDPPQPIYEAFRGLSTKIVEGSFSDLLTDKLEENYMKCRSAVMNTEGYLTTPLRFLSILSDRMGIKYHAETFQFNNVLGQNDKQFRTEMYFGGFCGVAHALSMGFSRQLAAAHVLERMRIHFRGIKQTSYALYPGNRYTKMEETLKSLCERYKLGEVQLAVKDRRKQLGGGIRGRGWGGGFRFGDLDVVKWECSCFVQKLMATVLSDDPMFGSYMAMKEMYLNFVKPPEVPVIQIKDYFAIGVDCPMFKDIHCSLLLHRPTKEKIMWMEEYGVPSTQLDAVLNDPRNNSGYLMGASMAWKIRQNWRSADEQENRFVKFREQLDEALEWMQGAYRRNNLLGGARLRQPPRQNGQGRGGQGERIVEEVAVAMETGNGGGDAMADAEDLEVEEIFHDACMEL